MNNKECPEGYHTLQAVIGYKDAAKAIDFYKKAFGATERYVLKGPRDQGVMHAELKIGDSVFMLGDENPEMGCRSVESYGGSGVSFYCYVPDADVAFKKAVGSGAKVKENLNDSFWGDRTGTVTDPFGINWTFATRVKELSQEEIKKAADDHFAHQAITRR
jgi:PhnB protein